MSETNLRKVEIERVTRTRQAESFARDENYETKYGQTCAELPEGIINFHHDLLACVIALS